MDTNQKIIYEYLHRHHICTLSTVTADNKPESAAMAFSETEKLEIIFQCPNTTRKYTNLQINPNIAIVVGWDLKEFITIQYEGIAREATLEEIDRIREIHVAKNPTSKPYAYIPENKYFIVTPTWIRYLDLKINPPKTIVVNQVI